MTTATELLLCIATGAVCASLVMINVELGRIRASLLRSESKR